MKKYILKRMLLLVPVLLGITFLSFFLMYLAGGDVVLQKAETTGIALSKEAADAQRAELGLDRPFIIQYLSWLGGFLTGHLGVSYTSGRNVFTIFTSKLPATLFLTGTSLFLTLVISVPLGILCAVRQNRITDCLVRACSLAGISLPNFLIALLLMYLFSIRLHLFPVISNGTNWKSVILPAVTLTIPISARYVRQIRSAVLDELDREYVLAAKARGIRFSVTLQKSIMRAVLITLLTLLSLSAGSLLGGTAVVETVFMWDGIGKLAVDAINMRDYPVIQAYVAWVAVIYVCLNLVTDLLYCAVDPRIRKDGEQI